MKEKRRRKAEVAVSFSTAQEAEWRAGVASAEEIRRQVAGEMSEHDASVWEAEGGALPGEEEA